MTTAAITSTTGVPTAYKAAVYESYGKIEDVLQLTSVATEPLPSPNHVRIQVHSAALNPIDYKLVEGLGKLFSGKSPSADQPFRIGYDAAGVVVEVGAAVSPDDFQAGDAVLAMAPTGQVGTLAEFVCVDAQFVARKPTKLSFTEAAAVPLVSSTSYQALVEHAKLQRGERVLVLGGSTSVGMFAIQLAKALGAQVVATASTSKIDLVRSLGADEVIDYTTHKWHEQLAAHSVGVVYDCAVEPVSWNEHAQEVLKKESGRFVTLNSRPPVAPIESKYGATRSAVFGRADGEHLRAICDVIERGAAKPVVDSVFPLEQLSAAFARVKSGRATGKVVVDVVRSAAP